jgi:hypothetical protein
MVHWVLRWRLHHPDTQPAAASQAKRCALLDTIAAILALHIAENVELPSESSSFALHFGPMSIFGGLAFELVESLQVAKQSRPMMIDVGITSVGTDLFEQSVNVFTRVKWHF